jgi:FlaA1/EpsC-like NDP-sugar epimerase
MRWQKLVSPYSRLLVLGGHVLLLAFTYFVSFLLRFDFMVTVKYQELFLGSVAVILLVKIPIFAWAGLLRGWWRYAGIDDLLDIVKAATLSSLIIYPVVAVLFRGSGFPRSVLVIDLLLTILAVGALRFSVRLYQETSGRHVPRKNTLVVGAGQAGSAIVRELKQSTELDLNPIGYVDDDESKQGIKIQGVRVLGTTAELRRVVEERHVECVLIAIPSANGSILRKVVDQCTVDLRILPAIGERINGTHMSKVRSVQMEDLLGRRPVMLDLANIRQRLSGKVLMITGAGGSIGSELARQLASFEPRRLVLFERAENDLHRIDLELRASFPNLDYVPVVGDILDVRQLRDVIAVHRPQSIFHAAAYKHVPMMEKNCFQAVVNNVFGTYNVALVAKQLGVEDFLMISSDKAVNPTNIMGVTKRVAELVILGLQREHTRFVSVRFGNVLGSNGSVLPLFEQQLARGGPLTVTHPDAQRYFMTIPEAVQLVLQASTMGKGGEIFVLDMGSPLKIADLARNLIRLSGLTPDQDIKIVYSGLRPGEKLFEELKLDVEGIKPTSHEKIRVLDGGTISFSKVTRWLEDLSGLTEARNVHGLVRKLQEIVPEYAPSTELLALSDLDRHDRFLEYKRARVELFQSSRVESQPSLLPPHAA